MSMIGDSSLLDEVLAVMEEKLGRSATVEDLEEMATEMRGLIPPLEG